MRRAALSAVLLILFLLPIALAQERVTVTLKAEPSDCAVSLFGAGSYASGSTVSLRVVPDPRCRVVEWRVEMGGTSTTLRAGESILLTVTADARVTVVLERVYSEERPLVVISFSANVSGIEQRLPRPIYVIRGMSATFSIEDEIFTGDRKYVFLYWQSSDGKVYPDPTVTVVARENMLFTAYFYEFRRFLDGWYPASEFVRLDAREIPEGDRVGRIVGYKVQGLKDVLGVPAEVPRSALHLLTPVIEWYRRVRIQLSSPEPVEVLIDGRPTLLMPGETVLTARENGTFTLMAPDRTRTLRSIGPTYMSERVTRSISVALTYVEKEHAFLLRTLPYPLNELVFGFVDFSDSLLMLGWVASSAIIGAAVAAGAGGAAYAARSVAKSLRSSRATRGVQVDVESIEQVSQALSAKTRATALRRRPILKRQEERRVVVTEGLRRALQRQEQAEVQAQPRALETQGSRPEPAPAVPEDVSRLREQLLKQRPSGRFPARALCYLELDEIERAASADGMEFTGEASPLLFSRQAEELASRVAPGAPVSVVLLRTHDKRAAEVVFAEACRRAGVVGHVPSGDVRALLQEARKRKARAVLLSPSLASRELLASLASAGIVPVVYGASADVKGTIAFPEMGERELGAALAALLASKGLLRGVRADELRMAGRLARALGGIGFLERVVALMELERVGLREALDRLTSAQLRLFMSDLEMEMLREIADGRPVEDVRRSFLKAAGQAAAIEGVTWEGFVEKLTALTEVRAWLEQPRAPAAEVLPPSSPSPASTGPGAEPVAAGEAREEPEYVAPAPSPPEPSPVASAEREQAEPEVRPEEVPTEPVLAAVPNVPSPSARDPREVALALSEAMRAFAMGVPRRAVPEPEPVAAPAQEFPSEEELQEGLTGRDGPDSLISLGIISLMLIRGEMDLRTYSELFEEYASLAAPDGLPPEVLDRLMAVAEALERKSPEHARRLRAILGVVRRSVDRA